MQPSKMSAIAAFRMRGEAILAIGVSLVAVLLPRIASAFEGQWHVGGGLGLMSYGGDTHFTMPELALHGAYGLSNVFDVRLELGESLPLSSGKSNRGLGYAEAVLAYKLDIIEWIPWAGLGAGAFAATGDLQGRGREALQPAASLWFGLDYAFNREWGAGAFIGMHSWFADSTRSGLHYAATNFGLRIERRFGW